MNAIATKLILDLVHSGLNELAQRTDNKIDDNIVNVIGELLHPSNIFGNSLGDGIEEEKEAKKALWKADDEAFRK